MRRGAGSGGFRPNTRDGSNLLRKRAACYTCPEETDGTGSSPPGVERAVVSEFDAVRCTCVAGEHITAYEVQDRRTQQPTCSLIHVVAARAGTDVANRAATVANQRGRLKQCLESRLVEQTASTGAEAGGTAAWPWGRQQASPARRRDADIRDSPQ